jgi:LPXTG-motif cell wall-anchored protein
VPANPATGALPALPPGQVTAVDNGVAVPVEVEVVTNTQVVVRTPGVEFRLTPQCVSACAVATSDDGSPVLQLEPTGGVLVQVTGARPGTTAYVWLFSEPRLLGEVTIGADGTFDGVLPLDGIEDGTHTLQITMITANGSVRTANFGVVVTASGAPTPGPGVLPSTGNGLSAMLLLVAALLLMTGGLALAGRRREVAARR